MKRFTDGLMFVLRWVWKRLGDLSVAAWLWTIGGGTASAGISGWLELLSWQWAVVTGVGVSLIIAGIILHFRSGDSLEKAQVQRDGGTVSVRDPSSVDLPGPVERHKREGELDAARNWLIEKWQVVKSWPNLIEFLRLVELKGDAVRGLEEHRRLRNQLPGDPPKALQAAETYYLARIRGQSGFINDALSMHAANVAQTPPNNLYQLRSWFEKGQLQFRIENFEASRATFGELSEALQDRSGFPSELVVDILKFRATFEVLHVVFDVPYADIPLGRWQAGNWKRCRELSERAIEKARECEYRDGTAWGLTVLAFAWEGAGETDKAEQSYEKADGCLSEAGAKRNSMIYAKIYRAGFERRRGNVASAVKALDRAENLLIDGNLHHYGAAICEQRGLVARKRKQHDEARRLFRKALRYYAHDPALRYRFEWPKVRRLTALAEEFGWELREFFDDRSHEIETG